MQITKTITALTLSALLVPAAAQAAPARTGNLAATGAEFKWDGAAINGADATGDVIATAGCTPVLVECDETLLKVDALGALSVKISDAAATATDLDLAVFASDASGKEGKLVKESVGSTAAEATTFDAEPGYYLVRVSAATAVQGSYKGTATLAAPSEGATTEVPLTPVNPAANAAPKTKITKPKGKKITALKGTASDDAKVAKVAVGLVKVSGKKCFGLTAKGSFKKLAKCSAPTLLAAKGTTSWSLKLKKALAKGKYVAYAIATDDKGLAEGGYGAANKVAFTVK